MPRFQNYNPPGESGGGRFGGGGLGQPGIVPPPDPVQTGGVGGGTINFTAGGPTLQALRERQKRLQQAAPELPPATQMTSPWQGASYLANTLVNSLQQNAAAAQEEKGSQEFANAMSTGIDWNTGEVKPEAMSVLMARDPEVGMQFIGEMIRSRREKVETVTGEEAKARGLDPTRTWQIDITGKANDITPTTAESYGPVVTGDQAKTLGLDPAKSYQLNQKTGQYDQIGGAGTSVTVNPPSAETAAKLGLARGFLDNYDAILKSVDAGEMTGGGYISGVQLGRGNGGTQYRNLKQGTEALIRILTGAGMSENEAMERAKNFEPVLTDDAPTLRSKVEGLKQAIDNVIQGVQTRGQGEPSETAAPAATETTAPAPETAAPAPAAAAETPPVDGGWPEGITEQDIQETLKAHPDVTRDALKKSLSKPRGVPNGP